MNTQSTSVIYDKIYYTNRENEYEHIVCNWNYDSINNKIRFEKDEKMINQINKIIMEIIEYLKNDPDNDNLDRIKILGSGGKYYLSFGRSWRIFGMSRKLFHIENDNWELKTQCYYEGYAIYYDNNDILVENHDLENKTIVRFINSEKCLKFDNYFPGFKKIKDNIICSCVKTFIYLYDLDTDESKNIDIKYGNIRQFEILKEKIFMLVDDDLKPHIAIYDIKKETIEIDFCCKNNILKFDQVIVSYDNIYDLVDNKTDCKIFFLTLNIHGIKTHDMYFSFK